MLDGFAIPGTLYETHRTVVVRVRAIMVRHSPPTRAGLREVEELVAGAATVALPNLDGSLPRCQVIQEVVRQRDGVVVVGITDHARRQLGDIVFVELPKVSERLNVGDAFGSVESVKAVSEVYAPVSGQIIKVNEEINESPENINTDPSVGWQAGASGLTDHATADLRGQRSVVVSLRHASPTSHGMKTA